VITARRRRLVVAGGGDGDGVARAAYARARHVALAAEPDRVAVALAGLIAGFGILGSLYRLGIPLALFDLDGEGKPPAAFSGALLVCAGLLGWMIGDYAPEFAFRWRAIGILFVFMGVDETLAIHESFASLAGVFWQILYIPVALLAAVIWLMTFQRLRRGSRERLLYICAPLAWLTSQVLETAQAGPSDQGYGVMATGEELLEMIGSTLFLLALLIALRRVASEPQA
jgi:hypothetical protein